ncbi:conjugal transfer protein TraB [Streptomyces sp. NPDC127084]|uniref:conjugal transfer protein TraB n=1 Tax=Streptomyces sp. NPDC127084 TaxID=3347133 RepID=UPI0036482D47
MGETAPAVGADGAANGFTALTAKFTALQRAAGALVEEAERLAVRMRANANAAVELADLNAAAEVDPRHIARTADIGEAFGRVVGGCKALQGAADTVHTAAGNVKAAHQAEYGPTHAAVTASRARQAKPGFYRPLL